MAALCCVDVSLIVRDKVTRPCPQTTTFEEKGEPKRYRTFRLPAYRLTARPNRLSNSSKLRQWRSYIRAAVHRRCQLPPKGLGTNKTVKAT